VQLPSKKELQAKLFVHPPYTLPATWSVKNYRKLLRCSYARISVAYGRYSEGTSGLTPQLQAHTTTRNQCHCPSAHPRLIGVLDVTLYVWQVCKVNKQKLIVEEVEQFTDISIADLVEGTFVSTFQDHRIDTKVRSRTSRECATFRGVVIRAQIQGRKGQLSAHSHRLGSVWGRDWVSDTTCWGVRGIPERCK